MLQLTRRISSSDSRFSLTKPWPPACKARPRATQDGFLFNNKTISSCVVYKKIQGRSAPVYISADGPLPPGKEPLIPKPKCKVWFSSKYDGSSMVSSSLRDAKEIDLTGNTAADVWYTERGLWASSPGA